MDSTRCTICHGRTAIDMHHTVPRSRGGEDSLQIPLCSVCHKSLHFHALALCARIRSGKPITKVYWKSAEEQERAEPYLEILVKALLSPIPEGVERKHLISCVVDTDAFEYLKLLQLDIGANSQEATILYCLNLALEHRGLKHVKDRDKANLWFMLGPE